MPFLALVTGVFSSLGNKTSLLTYARILFLLSYKDYWFLFFLLWSTEIPTDRANWTPNPAALISAKVKPLPSLGLWLYLMVWHLTAGLRASIGLGDKEAALDLLANTLLCFLCAWLSQTLTFRCQCFLKWLLGMTLLCLTIGCLD